MSRSNQSQVSKDSTNNSENHENSEDLGEADSINLSNTSSNQIDQNQSVSHDYSINLENNEQLNIQPLGRDFEDRVLDIQSSSSAEKVENQYQYQEDQKAPQHDRANRGLSNFIQQSILIVDIYTNNNIGSNDPSINSFNQEQKNTQIYDSNSIIFSMQQCQNNQLNGQQPSTNDQTSKINDGSDENWSSSSINNQNYNSVKDSEKQEVKKIQVEDLKNTEIVEKYPNKTTLDNYCDGLNFYEHYNPCICSFYDPDYLQQKSINKKKLHIRRSLYSSKKQIKNKRNKAIINDQISNVNVLNERQRLLNYNNQNLQPQISFGQYENYVISVQDLKSEDIPQIKSVLTIEEDYIAELLQIQFQIENN